MNKVVPLSVCIAIGIGMGSFIDHNLLGTPKSKPSLEASADGAIPSAPILPTMAMDRRSDTAA